MSIARIVLLAAVAQIVAATATAEDAMSKSVIGANIELTAGAAALRAGDFAEGIRLTLRGLPFANSNRERAAALSNLCAGYGAVEQYTKAIGYCDESLKLQTRNWRALQNRARARLGLGQVSEAIRDAEAGLEIAPQANALHQVLAVAERMQKQPHVIIDRFDIETVRQ